MDSERGSRSNTVSTGQSNQQGRIHELEQSRISNTRTEQKRLSLEAGGHYFTSLSKAQSSKATEGAFQEAKGEASSRKEETQREEGWAWESRLVVKMEIRDKKKDVFVV